MGKDALGDARIAKRAISSAASRWIAEMPIATYRQGHPARMAMQEVPPAKMRAQLKNTHPHAASMKAALRTLPLAASFDSS